jgi:hypothetical protein
MQIQVLLSIAILCPLSLKPDPFIPKLDPEWSRVDTTSIDNAYKEWNFRIWRNKTNGNLLTIAMDPITRELDGYGDLDRAMDFASSAHPEWLHDEKYPNWKTDDRNYEPRFIKLQHAKDTVGKSPTGDACKTLGIEYCMVNEDEDELSSMMACGFVFNVAGRTYYVQITSSRPVSDLVPKEIMKQMNEHFGA